MKLGCVNYSFDDLTHLVNSLLSAKVILNYVNYILMKSIFKGSSVCLVAKSLSQN